MATKPRPLTQAERKVLLLMSDGLSAKEIGRVLGRSSRTIEIHRARITAKLGARSAVHAVIIAITTGINDTETNIALPPYKPEPHPC